jgi:uncharacterized protein
VTISQVEGAAQATLAPAAASERIESIDVLRGVALLGILLMNVVDFGLPGAAYFNPTVDGATSGANLWAYLANWFAFEGSMRAIFSMLFGAGVVLLTSRGEERDASIRVADIYYRRTLLLILFGVIDAYLLLWYGDILYHYGMCGLALFVFRRASPRTLVLMALIPFSVIQFKAWQDAAHIRAIAPIAQEARALAARGAQPSAEQQAALAGYEAFAAPFVADEATKAKEIAERRAGYVDNVIGQAGVIAFYQSTLFYDFFFWDAVMMMLLGMALFKWHIFDASRSWAFYATMLVAGYGIGLSTNAYELHNAIESNFDLRWTVGTLMPTYDLGRGGTAFGHIALVMLVCKAGLWSWLTRALAAVGRMALTNYLSHSVICMFVFTGAGLGLFGALQRYELYYVVLAIWTFQLVTSPIWLRQFRFGPVEWVWRSLTYGQAQPMRARSSSASVAPT